MIQHFIILILTLIPFFVNAQTTDSVAIHTVNNNSSKIKFKNQGEQENYWSEQLFEKEYATKYFNKFKGDVLRDGNNFGYYDQTLKIINTPKELINIFLNGLFYPAIITGDIKSVIKSKQDLDTLSPTQNVFYNLTRTDCFTISDFEELKFLTKTYTHKRFRFWLFRPGSANPTVCFIELTNTNANEKTDLVNFINGSVLTFFKSGWLVI